MLCWKQRREEMMTQFHVGQEVVFIDSYSKFGYEQRATVDKVGRKYVTVTLHHREYQFDKETGNPAKPDQRNRIVTEEMRVVELEENRKEEFLRKHGIHRFELRGISREDFYGLYDYFKERGYE